MWLNDFLYDVGDSQSLEAIVVYGFTDQLHLLHSTKAPAFTQAEADRFAHSGRMALQAWSVLARRAQAKQQFLWQLKPKLHAWDHLTRDVASTRANPAALREFRDEDLNGKIVRLPRSGRLGASRKTLAKRVRQRWRLLLYLKSRPS